MFKHNKPGQLFHATGIWFFGHVVKPMRPVPDNIDFSFTCRGRSLCLPSGPCACPDTPGQPQGVAPTMIMMP